MIPGRQWKPYREYDDAGNLIKSQRGGTLGDGADETYDRVEYKVNRLRDESTDQDGTCDDDRLYYLTDANHNVTALVDMPGDGQKRYVNDPYGKVTIYDDDRSDTRSSSSEDNSPLYTGREHDEATGLYDHRARWYDTGPG